MKIRHFALLAIVLGGAFGSTTTSAFAWGCRAEGRGTSWGVSYDYSRRQDAEARAIDECEARPRAGRCVIVSCDRRR